MDSLEADRIVAVLVAGYPNWKPSAETVALYERMLLPLPAELAETAAMKILGSDRQFCPPIGVILHVASELALERAGRPRLSGGEAWEKVQHAIESCGFYAGPPDFGIPAISRAVAAVTWRELCHNSNVEASRAHFIRIYESIAGRDFERVTCDLSRGQLPQQFGNAPQIEESRPLSIASLLDLTEERD